MTPTDDPGPALTIVVSGRNDDYGETFSNRFQTFLRHLASLDERHKALFELIVVEWNPPPDRAPMAEAFDWSGLPMSRVITVSAELHASIPIAGNMPLLEFVAKNVGVRRATAAFVLSTNPDVVLSPAFFDLIGARTLDPRSFYRADRYDFAPEIAFQAPGADVFELATRSVFEVHTRNTIDPEEPVSHFVDPAEPMDQWPQSQPIYRDTLSEDGNVIFSGKRQDPLSGLHTQASGDFIMASREAWAKVRGHWERTDTYTHLDSFLVCHMHAAGLHQRILRRPTLVLHMDHSREDHKSRPIRPYAEVLAEIRQAAAGTLPNPNDENWGLAQLDLPETRPARQRVRKRPAETNTIGAGRAPEHVKDLARANALASAQRVDALRKRSALDRELADIRASLQQALAERSGVEERLTQKEDELARLRDNQAAKEADTAPQAPPAPTLREMEISEALRQAHEREIESQALKARLDEMEAAVARVFVAPSEGNPGILKLAVAQALQIGELEQSLAIANGVARHFNERHKQAEAETAALHQQAQALAAEHQIASTTAAERAAALAHLNAEAPESDDRIAALAADVSGWRERVLGLEVAHQTACAMAAQRVTETQDIEMALVRAEALRTSLQLMLENLQTEHDAMLSEEESKFSRLQNALMQAELANETLQRLANGLETETGALLRGREVLELNYAAVAKLADDRGAEIIALQASIAAERANGAEYGARIDLLIRGHEALDLEYAAVTKLVEDREAEIRALQTSLAAERDSGADHRARTELLQNRITQLRAESDDIQNAAREQSAKHAAERAAADARYDQLVHLVGLARNEELELLRAGYEQWLEALRRAATETERLVQTLDSERQAQQESVQTVLKAEQNQREAEVGQRAAELALSGERTRRSTAETLLQALEGEGVAREQRVAALELALAEAQRALNDASSEHEHALASYKSIMENSRYMKARRVLLRLLGRA